MFQPRNQAGKNKIWLILLIVIIFIVGWLLWSRSKTTKPAVELIDDNVGISSANSQKQNSETPSATSTAEQEETPEPAMPLTVSPTTYYLEHKIGSSPCPQKIGDINISGQGQWKISGSLPAWIRLIKTNGTAPDSIDLNFNCILSQYVNQELNGTFVIDLTDSAGEFSSQTISVNGLIKE